MFDFLASTNTPVKKIDSFRNKIKFWRIFRDSKFTSQSFSVECSLNNSEIIEKILHNFLEKLKLIPYLLRASSETKNASLISFYWKSEKGFEFYFFFHIHKMPTTDICRREILRALWVPWKTSVKTISRNFFFLTMGFKSKMLEN